MTPQDKLVEIRAEAAGSHYGNPNHIIWLLEHVETLQARAERFEAALRAYNYYWPRRRSPGGGQAEGTLSCGHCGRIGAPCCRDCAIARVNKALAGEDEK